MGLVSFLFLPENPEEVGLAFDVDGDDVANPLAIVVQNSASTADDSPNALIEDQNEI